MKNKRYIVTPEHPELKHGIILEFSTHSNDHHTPSNMWAASNVQIDVQLEKGYIKEIQEPEFTRAELKEIVYHIFGGDKQIVYHKINEYLTNYKNG
ncbi:MAG: hypothetical protein IIB56_02220 [Planctomycetes bacterium]|nr:hypothetical protein [Planctomycetota bacterium]